MIVASNFVHIIIISRFGGDIGPLTSSVYAAFYPPYWVLFKNICSFFLLYVLNGQMWFWQWPSFLCFFLFHFCFVYFSFCYNFYCLELIILPLEGVCWTDSLTGHGKIKFILRRIYIFVWTLRAHRLPTHYLKKRYLFVLIVFVFIDLFCVFAITYAELMVILLHSAGFTNH